MKKYPLIVAVFLLLSLPVAAFAAPTVTGSGSTSFVATDSTPTTFTVTGVVAGECVIVSTAFRFSFDDTLSTPTFNGTNMTAVNSYADFNNRMLLNNWIITSSVSGNQTVSIGHSQGSNRVGIVASWLRVSGSTCASFTTPGGVDNGSSGNTLSQTVSSATGNLVVSNAVQGDRSSMSFDSPVTQVISTADTNPNGSPLVVRQEIGTAPGSSSVVVKANGTFVELTMLNFDLIPTASNTFLPWFDF